MSTTITIETPCPACAGLSQPGHPGGWLAGWHHLQTCELLPHEDSRREADGRLLPTASHPLRPASPTERMLLAALGMELPDGSLTTVLTPLTPSVIRRRWPELAA